MIIVFIINELLYMRFIKKYKSITNAKLLLASFFVIILLIGFSSLVSVVNFLTGDDFEIILNPLYNFLLLPFILV